MPSPFAHALAGLTVHVLAARTRGELRDSFRAAVVVGAALAPDVDLLFRFVDGRNHHNNESHSLGIALLAGIAGAIAFPLLRLARPYALACASSLAWASHTLLDYLNRDTSPPIGLMALWPWTDAHYKFPWPLFMDIGRTLDATTVRHNVVAVAWEAFLLVPLFGAALLYRSRRLE